MARSVKESIKRFRADKKNDILFAESELELDLTDRMTAMRNAANLSQEELGERLGRTQSFISKMESGGYERCGIGTLRTFARAMAFDINVETMFAQLDSPIYAGFVEHPELDTATADEHCQPYTHAYTFNFEETFRIEEAFHMLVDGLGETAPSAIDETMRRAA